VQEGGVQVKITFEGREWEFSLEAIDLKQGVAIHLAYGFTLDAWFRALGDTDPRALQCLWWLMLQQDGQVMPIQDANCGLIALAAAFGDAQDAEDEAEPEPDPTSPPSPPGGPPSPGSATPAATTPPPPARRGGGRPTASTPGP
jgi:hypothetical protein